MERDQCFDQKRTGWIPFEWEEARIEVMEALGYKEDAQAFRWSCFERPLNEAHLRDYLKRLPEFEDFEAGQRAMATALARSRELQAREGAERRSL